MNNNNNKAKVENKEANVVAKPLQLVIDEVKQDIVMALNKSGLHISVLDMIMSQICNEVKQQAIIVNDMERSAYEKAVSEQK